MKKIIKIQYFDREGAPIKVLIYDDGSEEVFLCYEDCSIPVHHSVNDYSIDKKTFESLVEEATLHSQVYAADHGELVLEPLKLQNMKSRLEAIRKKKVDKTFKSMGL